MNSINNINVEILEKVRFLEERVKELYENNEIEEDEETDRDKCINNQWTIIIKLQDKIIEYLEIYDYENAKRYIELSAIVTETMDKISCFC